MSYITRAFVAVFIVLFTGNALAAYDCPSSRQYTSCASGYYPTQTTSSTACYNTVVTANSCTACPSGYTCSGGTVTTTSTCPKKTCSAGTYLAAGASSCTTCPAGYYCPGGTYYYSTSIQGRTACPTNYNDGGTGVTSISGCKWQTTAGTYVATANTTTASTCTAGYYCPSTLISYGSTGGRTSCPTNYNDGGTGVTSISGCDWQTTPGTYVATANATTATTCTSGYYCPSALISYGSTGSRTACPTNYDDGGTGVNAIVNCAWQTTAGTYIATANATTATTCTAGYYCTSTLIFYGSYGGRTSCPTNYDDGAAGATDMDECVFQTTAGTYISSPLSSTATTCTAGYYCPSTLVNYGSTGGRTACPTNYTSGGTGLTVSTDCKISCAAGTRIAARYDTSCTSPSGGWYSDADLVNYSNISSINYCMNDFTSASTSASGHDAKTDCSNSVAAGYYIPASTIQARYVRIASNGSTANTGNHVSEVQAFTASDATGTNLLSGVSAGTGTNLASATDGSWARSPYSSCTSISGCIWDMGSVKTLGSLKFSLYTDGRTYYDVAVYVSTDNTNWTQVFGTVDLPTQAAATSVGEVIVLSSLETSCAAGTALSAHTVTLGNTSSCTACTGATYSAAAAGTCSSCPTNYDDDTTSNKTLVTQCQWQTTAGSYIATANATSATTCTSGSYCPSALVPYGSTGSIITCPTNYDDGGTGLTSQSSCVYQTVAGSYIATANATNASSCIGGYYCPAALVPYGSTGNIIACPTNYDDGGTAGKLITDCKWQTTPGSYIATANDTSLTTCVAGSYCPSALVAYGSTGNLVSCPTNYDDGATGAMVISACKWQTTAGTYIATANDTTATTCDAGYYCPSALISYGITGNRSACPTIYDDGGSGVTAITGCQTQTTDGYYIEDYGDPNETECEPGYYCPANLINYGSVGGLISCPANYNDGGKGLAQIYDCKMLTSDGYYIENAGDSTLTICPKGYYCSQALVQYDSIGSISACPTGYIDGSIGAIDRYDCQIQTTDGTYIATVNDDFLTDCPAGSYCTSTLVNYGSTGSLDSCLAGTFSDAGATECTDCAIGSYSAAAADSCSACQDGTTTTAVGQSSCNAICANSGSYDTSWALATWVNNVVNNLCVIDGCAGGYFIYADMCSPVDSGYWSADGSTIRTACDSGLTTIGFGPGADEAADCGHKMFFGEEILYLRSGKKTTPSLNMRINGDVFYGNMTTDGKGSLRIKSSDTQYSVYDDSM